jgi:hypothetical protein
LVLVMEPTDSTSACANKTLKPPVANSERLVAMDWPASQLRPSCMASSEPNRSSTIR